MFSSMLYFLPSIVCMLWLSTFIFKVKTPRQKILTWVLALGIYYFATYAIYINPQNDYLTMVKMDAINEPLILTLLPLILYYLWYHVKTQRMNSVLLVISFIPAIGFGAMISLLFYLIGFENAATLMKCNDNGMAWPEELNNDLSHLFIFFDVKVFNIFCAIFFIIAMVLVASIGVTQKYRLGDVFRFFFMGKSTTPSRAIAFLGMNFLLVMSVVIVMGRDFLLHNHTLGATTTVLCAIIIHFIAHVEYFSSQNTSVSLHSLSHIANTGGEEKVASTETPVEEEPVKEEIRDHRSLKSDILTEKVVLMFEKDEIFRQDNLTLEMLSQRTGIGRNTLSSLITHHYGMSFRDVVNHYRVDAVKKYLLENPSATQEAAAYHCGFKDASSLNRKFRELENDTPLMWLTHHQAAKK